MRNDTEERIRKLRSTISDPNMSDIFFRELGMPEEINRKLTDAISDLLFVTEESTRGPAGGSSRSAFQGTGSR